VTQATSFDPTVTEDTWTMSLTDPDFHQRLVARVEGNGMIAQTDASADCGRRAAQRLRPDLRSRRVT